MKKLLLVITLVSQVFVATAQKAKKNNVDLYAYNGKWEACELKDAAFLVASEKLSDSAYQWKYYHATGPLMSVETYKDAESKQPHGYFAFFDDKGRMDSCGYSSNGRKDRSWLYFTDSMTLWQTEKYEAGKLLERKDQQTLRREEDSIKNDPNYEKDVPGERLADFKGGSKAWIKFLQSHVKYPDRAEALKKEGTVRINFMVRSDGTLGEINVFTSIEYSLDEEALRLITSSPNWIPALVKGKPARAYRRMPITFSR